MESTEAKAARSTTASSVGDSSRPYRGRRLSWAEFYQLRPDLKPANDNHSKGKTEAA